MAETKYDLIGIGLGPFNLGLAALVDNADHEITSLFLEKDPEFNWHDGMLIESTALQSNWIGDLVTPADPTSSHSFLNYLREHDRIWEFFNYEDIHIPRREYNEYCRWVSEQLDTVEFSREVVAVEEAADGGYVVEAVHPETGEQFEYHAADVVLGVGSRPNVPENLACPESDDVIHTSQYLHRRDDVLEGDSVTVVGSGQSASEVVLDLLRKQKSGGYRLDWFTRSDGFYPIMTSKLPRDVRTPNYMDYFYDLPRDVSKERVQTQDLLYKGISPGTSNAIYDTMYKRSISDDLDMGMLPTTEVEDIEPVGGSDRLRLQCRQWEEGERFVHESEFVILGTGYHRPTPSFLDPIESNIEFDEDGRFSVERNFEAETTGLDGRLFVQNAAMPDHGFNVADLSLGCFKNAKIINTIVGEKVYPEGDGSRFQSFSTEQYLEDAPNSNFLKEQTAVGDD